MIHADDYPSFFMPAAYIINTISYGSPRIPAVTSTNDIKGKAT